MILTTLSQIQPLGEVTFLQARQLGEQTVIGGAYLTPEQAQAVADVIRARGSAEVPTAFGTVRVTYRTYGTSEGYAARGAFTLDLLLPGVKVHWYGRAGEMPLAQFEDLLDHAEVFAEFLAQAAGVRDDRRSGVQAIGLTLHWAFAGQGRLVKLGGQSGENALHLLLGALDACRAAERVEDVAALTREHLSFAETTLELLGYPEVRPAVTLPGGQRLLIDPLDLERFMGGADRVAAARELAAKWHRPPAVV